jgi:hypothetical protein
MASRRYTDAKADAACIASEVIMHGSSERWCGGVEIGAEIERTLADFNIGYVDDMFGSWAKRPGGSSFFKQG